MASHTNSNPSGDSLVDSPSTLDDSAVGVPEFMKTILAPLASLKLTVALFLASIVIVLAGTFAQVDYGIWKVVDMYFRVDLDNLFSKVPPFFHYQELFVWIHADLFFPESFFPPNPTIPDSLSWMGPLWPDGTKQIFPDWCGIYFPKGWTIGMVMALNLLAAHAIRFKIQASGTRLKIGAGILAFGALFTYLVIISGSNPDGLQSKPLISYDHLRLLMLMTTFGLCGASLYGTVALEQKEKKWMAGIGAFLLAFTAVFIASWKPSDEASMRILYQLVKATFAAAILLAGCIAVFKRRAGVVLLHAGIGLMMFYDVLVGVEHIESQMTIVEGESANYSRDIREVEFAVIDRSGQDEDLVTVVPASKFYSTGSHVSDALLPFDMEVIEYYPNSDVRGLRSFGPNEEQPDNPADAGIGTSVVAIPKPVVKGTETGGAVDIPSAYVKLTSKDGDELGVWLVSALFDIADTGFGKTQTVRVDGKVYDIALRYVRHYNDYTITLNDVQKNDYKGTSQVKDYSSYITLSAPEQDLEFDYRIWMNNPMRFAGKTFYQSGYSMTDDGQEVTTLQVVDNVGWMTPYVSCMIVWVGMMFHFGQTLLRYLGRRARQTAARRALRLSADPLDQVGYITSAAICGSILLTVFMLGRPPAEKADEFHYAKFGELPMWYKGRPMPIDSFARNTLLKFSDYESWRDADGEKHPATEWVLLMMTDEEQARDARIFKIENKELIEALGLEDRPKFTYSFNELLNSDKVDGIEPLGMLTIIRNLEGLTQIDNDQPREFEVTTSDVPEEELTLFQRKLIQLSRKIEEYVLLEFSLGGGRIIDLMQQQSGETAPDSLTELAFKIREFDRLHRQAFRNVPLALVVPTHFDVDEDSQEEILQADWEPVTKAKAYEKIYEGLAERFADQPGVDNYETPPAIEHFLAMLNAFDAGNVEQFNTALDQYKTFVRRHATQGDDANLTTKTGIEAVYNRFGAFNFASWLYVFSGVLAALGWLCFPQVFQRSALWTNVTIFSIHTLALAARIYISGRPPVTNLYSSAIFIGWAIVLGSLLLEWITRLGIGNVVASVSGFLTLRIADGLAAEGDTFVVLEAVLDTQFWLATHVVCITLGYATTYLAGLIGLFYILLGLGTPLLSGNVKKEITRMIYGVLCFATFFSFVGTVLGGLWADDSWGRFWGWDPKENGALIIVLWNALVLHARWGGMVKDRGLAVLSVLGNIVVSWSWFGVNELGVGLHSYGFTEGRMAWLTLFVMSQLLFAGIGLLPGQLWWSNRTPPHDLNDLESAEMS